MTPEFVEAYISPASTAATSVVPSAEDAMAIQFVRGALVCVQVWADAAKVIPRQAHPTDTVDSRYLMDFIFPTVDY